MRVEDDGVRVLPEADRAEDSAGPRAGVLPAAELPAAVREGEDHEAEWAREEGAAQDEESAEEIRVAVVVVVVAVGGGGELRGTGTHEGRVRAVADDRGQLEVRTAEAEAETQAESSSALPGGRRDHVAHLNEVLTGKMSYT